MLLWKIVENGGKFKNILAEKVKNFGIKRTKSGFWLMINLDLLTSDC